MAWQLENNPAIWEKFLERNAPESGAFLHSWAWGDFQAKTGKQIRRLGWREGKELRGVALLIEMKMPFGRKYFYCPRGPVFQEKVGGGESMSLKEKAQAFKELAAAMAGQGGDWLRFDPPVIEVEAWDSALQPSKAIQPPDTLLLDLSADENQLLSSFHEKTRYNIRLAKKKGVSVNLQALDFAAAWPIFSMTAGRDDFRLHEREYYLLMLQELKRVSVRAFLATASWQDKLLAANIMIDAGQTRTYLHGASSNEERNVMAPHLLHWELICDAKKSGLATYDWWGVAPKNSLNHPWSGVTRFKQGFGGRRLSYAGTFDKVLHRGWYAAYQAAKKIHW